MANLSQQKRERMLEFLKQLKSEHTDDASLMALNEIENALISKKYGLVWEQHEEQVDVMMRDNVPVFTEVVEHEIKGDPDSDQYNFLLEGDNLHSLKLLEKTHRGCVDVIYIDPPYGTGNKDFIYNDSFVDSLDGFRHSKWISFMYERLCSARRLLSKDGVLIISIGYQEVNNLMLLCEEIFHDKQIVCVTVQTSGGKPNGGFTFVHEYLVYVTSKEFAPNAMSFTGGNARSPFEGLTLSTFDKVSRPNQTYPIFIDKTTKHIVGVGKSLAERIEDGTFSGSKEEFVYDFSEAPDGCAAVFPISSKGAECVWRLIPSRLLSDWDKGYIKVSINKSKVNPNEYSIQYLPEGVIKKIESGELEVIGHEDGMPTLIFGENQTVGSEIPTIWSEKEFFTNKGSVFLKELFEDKRFSYPKPLEYMVEILKGVAKPNSVILDFFSGSATTAHAVMELNNRYNWSMKYIMCTNNESGICENVTYPRLKTVITGTRPSGSSYATPVKANLKHYKTEFVSKVSDQDSYSVSDELLKHIKEMIQLENGINVDGKNYIIILSDDDADELEKQPELIRKCKGIYISNDVFLTSSQEQLFAGVVMKQIPDYYFEDELREVHEIW